MARRRRQWPCLASFGGGRSIYDDEAARRQGLLVL
jgi:hypothetical protein